MTVGAVLASFDSLAAVDSDFSGTAAGVEEVADESVNVPTVGVSPSFVSGSSSSGVGFSEAAGVTAAAGEAPGADLSRLVLAAAALSRLCLPFRKLALRLLNAESAS